MTKLDDLINDISTLGLTTKEASAQTTPEDNLVGILQGISASLTKQAEEGEVTEEPKVEVEVGKKESEPIADAVAAAVAAALSNKEDEEEEGEEGEEGEEPNNEENGEEEMNDKLIQKISQAVAGAVKQAVEGDAAFGLAGDASQGNPAGAGVVQNMAEKILAAKTTTKKVNDPEMVSPGGAVDPMIGVAPTPQGGEQEDLQAKDIKAAMANMSDEDVTMIFKLASIGYDVSVETLSDEIVQEKVAQAQYAEKVAQAQAWQQAQYNAYMQKVAQANAYNPYYTNYPNYRY